MSEFLDRISKLSPQRLALLADELNERLQASERRRRAPLAVVGIGCRLPGGVTSPEEFWKLLSEGVDAVGEVPPARWNIDEFYDRNPDTPGKMATRWGGFIDHPDQFDPKFFGIAPAEAICMDPQQRLLLETAWEALEHAGIAPAGLSGSSTGVFVGICNGDYSQVALSSPRESITPYFASGLSHAIAAGRISYVLGLQGPSLAVDTSCSASLVAVHLACQSLRLGECDTALAGGVNLILSPDVTIALSQSRMMAPDGRCKAFSETANGFVRGEGSGIIVLKRLPDAIRDGNQVLAVIRGSACNQDGRSNGLTAPNGPSQESVVSAALADAGLTPDDVQYIEAHGTGTSLGDPIEAGALNAVFSGKSSRSEPLFIGSVKTNLGHLESAAGIAGLIKLVLALQNKKIPASLYLGKPNSHIDWEQLPLKVPTELQMWNSGSGKRVGGVSSFGFSGTNAHVIVEEYPQGEVSSSDRNRPHLFTLSAKTESALASAAARLRSHLKDHPLLSLAEVAKTLNIGRSHFECRAGITAASHPELIGLLEVFQEHRSSPQILSGRVAGHSQRVAFVLGGETLDEAFGRELYEAAPAFRRAIDQCEEILKNDLDTPLTSILYPVKDGIRDGEKALSSRYRNAAEFASQYALAQLWRSCGIVPSVIAGSGLGAYVAACIAEVFSLKDGLRIATAHGGQDKAEYQALVRRVSYREPKIPLITEITDSDEVSVAFAEYWLRRSGRDGLTSPVLSALAKEGSLAHIYIGVDSALQRLQKSAGDDWHGNWVASLGDCRDDCRQFLNTAASLYVLGCDLDLSGFYGNAANTVSLPTYPFERERYWLDSENGRNVDSRTDRLTAPTPVPAPSEVYDEWVYDLVWEPKPLLSKSERLAVELDEDLIGRMSVTPANAELMRVADLTAAAMPVYSAYILQAFREAGLLPAPGSEFTLEELGRRLKVIPARMRALARLLAILVEDQVVEREEDRFRFVDFRQWPDADKEVERLGNQYPECRTEMEILRRCGKKLSAVLQGNCDPMQLVFAEGSIQEAEQIYENSPVCRFFNDKAAKVVRAVVDRIADRPTRILEIGGGTGATTAPICSDIYPRNFEYCFTDVSPVFLSGARTKFSGVPSMNFRLLNIENDPFIQGFQAGEYDIVLAANVLHATADLRRTLAHVRKLLAPGGILLLIEGVQPDRWLDLTFGLTDGWFRFTDLELRPDHPMVSAENWKRILGDAGMSSSRTISYIKDDGSLSQQTVIVAQADPEEISSRALSRKPDREWMICADDSGVGDTLRRLLSAMGEPCEIVRLPRSSTEIDSVFRKLTMRADKAELEIVYLWGIDVAGPIGSLEALQQSAKPGGETLIHLLQAVLARGKSPIHLSIVTRGAQATEAFSPTAAGTVQSLAWGVGRVFGLEFPEKYRGLIDLDPAMTPETAAASLLEELLTDSREDQIAYREGRRLAARLKKGHLLHSSSNKVSADASSIGLRADSSYLLVGGLGGVGLKLARWTAEQRPGHLILLSRTGTGSNAGQYAAERTKAIEEIRRLGINVTVVEGDVASTEDMKRLFARFGGELPALRGIFHAATFANGVEIADLSDELIETMLRPKVSGMWVLHELTKNLPLDFFVAFSSSASLLGGKGMAHYAAANQFLDAFAHFRRAAGLPMLSVNWGSWDALRLVSEKDQALLGESGILPMQSERALELLGDLIRSPRAQVMVANIDWDTLKPLFEMQRPRPLLEYLGGGRLKDQKTGATSTPTEACLHASIGMAPEAQKKFIETFVLEQAARVLGFRQGELPPVDVSLMDIGLDSLMAVDLKNRLQTGLGQELSPTVVFDYPTVSEIVGMLETMLWAVHGGVEDDFASAQKDEIRI